jgi:hypothetical protein
MNKIEVVLKAKLTIIQLRWNLPPLHHTFIGRDTSLSALNELLQSKKRRRRAGLVGLPGIG